MYVWLTLTVKDSCFFFFSVYCKSNKYMSLKNYTYPKKRGFINYRYFAYKVLE